MNPALNPTSSTNPIDARRANAPTASSRPTAPSPNREAFEPAAAARKAGGPGARPARRIGDRALYEADWLESMDRMTNAAIARATGGISPIGLAMDYFDWIAHLTTSPGKLIELSHKAARKTLRLARYAATCAVDPGAARCIEPLAQDRRFEHEAWQRFPFNVIHQAFLLNQQWWHNATTGIRGVSRHNEAVVSFIARQLLDMLSPSNIPFFNPEIVQATISENGANLLRGARYFADDFQRLARGEPPAGTEAFQVGKNVAVTPGKVVYRNRLMELIQYAPTTESVQREPVLMQSAWMMKYYIVDLSPHNSLVKYLVDRGHTVFVISWFNPGPEDRDLGMEDYRKLGTLAAVDAISALLPGRKIHAVGYCLGGILLTIAAATMARDGDDRLASITLFTTLVDFTEVGEIAVFMGPGTATLIEDMMWQRGYLDPKQAAGGFQLLKSNDLIWSKMVREYYLGQREPMFDLMAWNADSTRMPYRQHSELLRRFYGDNELFQGKYRVEGRPIAISDIHVPIFAVAAAGDHVAPWRSVYKLHLQSDAAELTFVLTGGGHNVGIVNEPGHPRRSFQMTTCKEGERALDAETWKARTPVTQGSWWPAWREWLVRHSSGGVAPPPMGAPDKGYEPLCDAPGTYVHQK
ncbi:MAG: alpha/beta fold hydrolase [Candidatus Competibacteraceae bacterium]